MAVTDHKRTWQTLAASLAAGEIAAFSLVRRFASLERGTAATIALGGLALGGWIFLCVWTWRRLIRRDASGRAVFAPGILAWGLPMWLTMAGFNAARSAGGLRNVLSASFAGEFLLHAFIGFPLWLWGGYLFGRAMGTFFNPRP